MKRLYHVEVKYTVVERYRLEAEFELDARRMAKSGDFEPAESVKLPERITASWPLAEMKNEAVE